MLFGDIGIDPLEARCNTPEGKALRNASAFDALNLAKAFLQPLVRSWGTMALSACRSLAPNYIILATLPQWTCTFIPEVLNIPYGVAHLAPMLPTVHHAPCVGFGEAKTWFEWSARAKWNLSASIGWSTIYGEPINQMRAEAGLPLQTENHFSGPGKMWDLIEKGRILAVCGYSAHLAPLPADVARYTNSHVTGQWDHSGLSEGKGDPIPEAVESFFSASRRPVVFITFGSLLALVLPTQAEQVAVLGTMVKACHSIGARALVATKGVELKHLELQDPNPENTMLVPGWLPHAQIMARCAAVICHGGSGTTHTALRAGCPVVAIPAEVASDQPWWAACLAQQGVGPSEAPYTEIKSMKQGNSLIRALQQVVGNSQMTGRCEAMAKNMKAESGADAAADAILRTLPRV